MQLQLDNGFRTSIPGLGRNKPSNLLSKKRVTKAVREILRQHYGWTGVEVSCSAEFDNLEWKGSCKINGTELEYRVSC